MKENIWEKLTEEHQIEMLNFYCKDDLRELRKICDPIIHTHEIPLMNHEDLYDVAIDTLADSISTYDEEKAQFNTYLTGNLKRKFIQWVTYDTRGCRCNVLKDENGKLVKDEKGNNIVIPDMSFDVPNEDGVDLKDIIPSGECIEDEIICTEEYSPEMKRYLSVLSKVQVRILNLLSDGYEENEIKEKLHISTMIYKDSIAGIRSFNKIKYIVNLI